MSLYIELNKFQVKQGDNPFLSPLTFSCEKPEFVVLIAPSGSGKTKLFESLSLSQNSRSPENYNGTVQIHQQMASVPQSLDLIRQESALHNVAMAGLSKYSSFRTLFSIPQDLLIEAEKQLKCLGFNEIEKPVYQLSGGEQQRVAMARIMMSPAKIWLLDEPVSQLDDDSAKHCLHILKKHAQQNKVFTLCILHQKHLSHDISDRQLIWNQGQWEQR